MIKSPSLKSYSTPSDLITQESYLQFNILKIQRRQIHQPSLYEEDQLDLDDQNNDLQMDKYIKRITGLLNDPPKSNNLTKYYQMSLDNDIISLISEMETETFADQLKLRQQNQIPMREEEVTLLAFNMLNGLTNCALPYLCPSDIIRQEKIANYMEQLLVQDQKHYLDNQDRFFYAPELLPYFEFEFEDCDDFNKKNNEDIEAPKGAIYSLGLILLSVMYLELKKENIDALLRLPKYSWSLRDLIGQMLLDEQNRPSAKQLLQNPIFYQVKPVVNVKKPYSQISLFVFINLIKQGITQIDWADKFFTTEEIISISEIKEGIQGFSEIKQDINSQIFQIIQKLDLNKLNVEEFIKTVHKIAAYEQVQQQDQQQPTEKKRMFQKWFSRKKEEQSEHAEVVILPEEPVQMAQIILLKTITGASEKTFKTFMIKFIHYMGEGIIYQNLRKAIWPKALGYQSLDAHREIIQLTLEICDYLTEAKQKDLQQLEKDLIRSKYSDITKNNIRTVIKGFINQQHHYCYIQGMESMTNILLNAYNNDTDLATITLVELFNKKIVPYDGEWDEQLWREKFNQKLQEKILLYKWLLNYIDPQLYKYLQEVGFLSEMYVISWFTNFYSREFPVEKVLKIYDALLLAEEYFEILFAGSIMLELRETFQIKDNDGIMGCLRNLQNNVSVEKCIQFGIALSNQLPRNFFTLTYQPEDVVQQMKENEFYQERPWEFPSSWEKLQTQQIFEITIHDITTMIKERTLYPLDMRITKEFEQVCIASSLFANYQNGKINPILINYFDLKSQVDEQGIYFVVIVYNSETQKIDEIINALLKLGLKKLCVLKGGIQAALIDGQDIMRTKVKAVLPPSIKTAIEEMKKQKL